MKIAVEGCCHGELDKIYETLAFLEKENNIKIDLLIICGDFQAVRNHGDLNCMAVPPRYRKLNTFYKYYSGELTAPVLTLFIGGNHEASNYLSELFYGGWVCPNIYYLGCAGVVNIGGLRIAGLSGIYKGADYLRGHYELPPYNQSTIRSIYHIRNLEVFRLKQMKQPVDIFISHDWPRGVYNHGNVEQLLRWKPFFRDEIAENKLGSRPSEELLQKLKPAYWFAAHLHCKFAALVPHEPSEGSATTYTKFLALDKCLPHRHFLQILDIGEPVTEGSPTVGYDAEWLCILRSTNHLLNVTSNSSFMPGPGCSERWNFSPLQEELDEIRQIFQNNFKVPHNFVPTADPIPPSDSRWPGSPRVSQPVARVNPQTTAFCQKVGITDPLAALLGPSPSSTVISDRKEFSFIDESDQNVTVVSQASLNPDEISIESSDDEMDRESSKAGSSSPDDERMSASVLSSSSELSPAAHGGGGDSQRTPATTDSDFEDGGNLFVIDRKGSSSSATATESPNLHRSIDSDIFHVTSEHGRSVRMEFCTSSPVVACTKSMDDGEQPAVLMPLKFKSDDSSEEQRSDQSGSSSGSKRAACETQSSCIKRMKRRNQAIYSSTDDGEDA